MAVDIEGMVSTQLSLNAKWVYIFSLRGVLLEATNNQIFQVPSGFFALSRDEIQQYFTNNYVTIHYYENDTFDAFCYDFTINSVQPLSDNVTPAILNFSSQMSQQLNAILQVVNTVSAGVEWLANNQSAEDVPNLGLLQAVYYPDEACFKVLNIRSGLSSFTGSFVFQNKTISVKPSFMNLVYKDSSIGSAECTFSSGDSFSIPIKFFDVDGFEIEGVEISGGGSFSGTVFSSSVGMRFKVIATEFVQLGRLNVSSDMISIGVLNNALTYTALQDYLGFFSSNENGGAIGVFTYSLSVWNDGNFQFSKGVK